MSSNRPPAIPGTSPPKYEDPPKPAEAPRQKTEPSGSKKAYAIVVVLFLVIFIIVPVAVGVEWTHHSASTSSTSDAAYYVSYSQNQSVFLQGLAKAQNSVYPVSVSILAQARGVTYANFFLLSPAAANYSLEISSSQISDNGTRSIVWLNVTDVIASAMSVAQSQRLPNETQFDIQLQISVLAPYSGSTDIIQKLITGAVTLNSPGGNYVSFSPVSIRSAPIYQAAT